MSPEERAAKITDGWLAIEVTTLGSPASPPTVALGDGMVACVRQWIAQQIREAVTQEREACAVVAENQEFYSDTHTGTRQLWVKTEIARKIRERGEGV